MELIKLLKIGLLKKASDIHIIANCSPSLRIDGELVRLDFKALDPKETKELVYKILTPALLNQLELKGEVDFSYSSNDIGRYRINAYKEKGNYGMAIRILPTKIATVEELMLPSIVRELSRLPRGLVLITGPSGSGKSTTLAAIIDFINRERKCHILTLEDPIEYIHEHKKSMISQREVFSDTNSFKDGLKAALRQDPDVILVGEMRDLETISTVLTAAETGHLVFSTLHTMGSGKTIDRIIDVFPSNQQDQIRTQLSSVLQAIISQQLLPRADSLGRLAAFEIMLITPGIKNLIRDKKNHQIELAIQMGKKFKMNTMDESIINLHKKGLISKETALRQSIDKLSIEKYII